ncbi:MAG: hypothetical protein KC492_04625, partial [Myxococcales bacterium]|nr:hypothetical protein [Myxococcales bacterium]
MSQPNEPQSLDQLSSQQSDWCELTETRYQLGDADWTEVPCECLDAAPWHADAQISPGSRTLQLGGVLASGGMGEVRRAVQVDLGRDVAV